MSDETVREALRSNAPLVVVEAPAGCGKTHQGAEYARELAISNCKRLLILTHTHAARSEFASRTKGASDRVEIRTIDSLIANIGSAYHEGIGLPSDVTTWAMQNKNRGGYEQVAMRVAGLLRCNPMIAASVAHRYPIVICDEHQDASGDQHAVVCSLLEQGAKLRVLADPMQRIFREEPRDGATPPYDWDELVARADAAEQLDHPHRWSTGCQDLGRWTLAARTTLQAGGAIDLRQDLPHSVEIVFAENQGRRRDEYRITGQAFRDVRAFVQVNESFLLVLTHSNNAARSFRSLFTRQIPLWEGHVRDALERLVQSLMTSEGDAGALAEAVIRFLGNVSIGASRSAFGNRFVQEAREGCIRTCRGRPARIQNLARLLVEEPDHRGVARVLQHLGERGRSDRIVNDFRIDHAREFWEAVRLADSDTADGGLVEITHRRTYSHHRPPPQAISTIHKAKGLQCEAVLLMPCDSETFPDTRETRSLLYVALSRPRSRLLLVVSRSNPSPLLII